MVVPNKYPLYKVYTGIIPKGTTIFPYEIGNHQVSG